LPRISHFFRKRETEKESERAAGGTRTNTKHPPLLVRISLCQYYCMFVQSGMTLTRNTSLKEQHMQTIMGNVFRKWPFFVRVRKGLIWKDLKKGCSKICLSYIENEYDTFEATCNSTRRRLPWHLQKLILQCRVCWLVSFCRCHHSSMLTD
jgi:hypothetical protein